MTNFVTHQIGGKIIQALRSIDGIILLAGAVGLFIFFSAEIGFLKYISFAIFLISISLGILSLRSKKNEMKIGLSNSKNENLATNELVSQEEDEMKKLVFDDFQSENGGKYIIQLAEEEIKTEKKEKLEITQTTNYTKKSSLNSQKTSIKPEEKQIPHEFKVSDFFDLDSEVYKSSSEPRTEFDYLLNKVLAVIKDVLFAHTVAFFWANREKGEMVCEVKVSDSQTFISNRRFPMQHDIVSKIAKQAKPEIISRVNPVSEKELIVYYEEPEFIKSFVGVPVFFQTESSDKNIQEPVAVIAIDCKTEEAFGHETLLLLGQFTKLISGLIKSYTDKYDLLLDAELLNSIHRFQAKIRDDLSVANISQSLVDETSKLLKWDFISIVMQDYEKQIWKVYKVLNRTGDIYIRPDTMIDFNESIIGSVIKNNIHILKEDLETSDKARYFIGEKIENSGSFVSIPLSSINKCYGALNVENKDKYNFSKQDIEVLYRLAENAAAALEVYYMNNIINEYVIIDELTGVYSKKFWFEKFSDELYRSDDFGEDLSLLFLNIDNIPELLLRYGNEGLGKILVTLSKVIRNSVRPYDLVGRLENNRFGIILVRTPANEAYLWAEKIRKTIAGVIIDLDGKSFSVTLSIGVCGATEGITKDELIKNTTTVLQKAIDSGGNTVRVF